MNRPGGTDLTRPGGTDLTRPGGGGGAGGTGGGTHLEVVGAQGNHPTLSAVVRPRRTLEVGESAGGRRGRHSDRQGPGQGGDGGRPGGGRAGRGRARRRGARRWGARLMKGRLTCHRDTCRDRESRLDDVTEYRRTKS